MLTAEAAEAAENDLLRTLLSSAHALPLNGNDIQVLDSPDQFFDEILEGLRTARRRVSIAALYLGTGGGREAEFAAALATAAHDPARPNLQMHVLLDALRCTRPTRGLANAAAPTSNGRTCEARSGGGGGAAAAAAEAAAAAPQPPMTSTAEMLAVQLLEGRAPAGSARGSGGAPDGSCSGSSGSSGGAPDGSCSGSSGSSRSGGEENSSGGRVRVSLFHTPKLRGLLKRVLPPRVSEVVGVMHIKCFAFDNTVLLTGANVSSTYLTTRQDRYLVLRSAPHLAAFLHQTVDSVGAFSYQLLAAGAAGGAQHAEPAAQRHARQAARTDTYAVEGGGSVPPPVGSSLCSGSGVDGSSSSASQGHSRPDGAPAAGSAPLLQLSARLAGRMARSSDTGSGSTDSPSSGWGSPRPHHLQRHRLQRAQRYRLGPCPAGVDPVRHAPLFNRQLRRELLRQFVPQPAWHSVLDFAALEAEAAQGAAEVAAAAVEECAAGAVPGGGTHGSGSSGSSSSTHPCAAVGADSSSGGGGGGGGGSVEVDTWVVPVVQAGFAGLRQDERCTLALLSWATQHAQHAQQAQQPWPPLPEADGSGGSGGGSPSVLLQLASPYLNLSRPLEWFLSTQASNAELELITSSPEANGFFGSKGLSGYVPMAYSLLEHRTWRRLNRHSGSGRAASAAAAWLQAQREGRARLRGRLSRAVGGGEGAVDALRMLRWWQRSAAPSCGGGEVLAGSAAAAAMAAEPAGSPACNAWAAGAEAREAGEALHAAQYPAAAVATNSAAGAPRRLLEYSRPGWEFHAKGLWVSLPQDSRPDEACGQQRAQHAGQQAQHAAGQHEQRAAQQAPGEPGGSGASPSDPGASSRWRDPCVTLVGSSNYGWRSLHRDLEVQFVLVTRNPSLQQALGREVAALRQHCQAVQGEAQFLAPGRRAGPLARMAVRLLRGFL